MMWSINLEACFDEIEKIAEFQKKALAGLDDVVGGLVGHASGKAQKARGENYSFGYPQVAGALLIPGGVGYQVGRYVGHQHKVDKKLKKK